MNFFSYGNRVNKIFSNEKATAVFRVREIVYAIVNLLDAQKELSKEEYFFVAVAFGAFNRTKKKLRLSRDGFVGLCNDIIAHFDLIAPYYQFCGNPEVGETMRLEECDKYAFRLRARAILRRKELFGEEWMELHEEFMNEFYSF